MKRFIRFIKKNITSNFISNIGICIISIISVISLSACVAPFSDRARSEQLFEQYCHEEGRVGQFIYERVGLGDEYFRPIPTDAKALRRLDNSFYINKKKLLIDKEHFEQRYTLSFYERKELSSIGPIYSVESTIVRNSDGKVLSKAVSLLNMQGKTSKHFYVEGVTCQPGRDSRGRTYYHKKHMNLIENTFFKR